MLVRETESIQSRMVFLYLITTEELDQNFCPSLQASYYSADILNPDI